MNEKLPNASWIDPKGRLIVWKDRAIDPTPKIKGWKPYWVTTNLDESPQTRVTYLREEN